MQKIQEAKDALGKTEREREKSKKGWIKLFGEARQVEVFPERRLLPRSLVPTVQDDGFSSSTMTIQDKASYGIDQEDKRSLDILKKVVFSQAGLSRSDFLSGSLGTGGIISQKLKRQIDFADDSDRAPEEIASSNMRTKHSRRDFLFQTRIGLHRLGEPDRYDRSGDLLKDTFRNFFNLRSTFNGPQIEVQHFQEPEKTWARIWFGTGLTWDIVDPRFLFHILFSCCSIFVWCFFSGSHRGRTHRDSLCSQGFLGLRTNGTMHNTQSRGFSKCMDFRFV